MWNLLRPTKNILKQFVSYSSNQRRTMIIRSLFDPVDLPEDKTFPQFMLDRFDTFGDRVAVINALDDSSLKFNEIRPVVNNVSAALARRNFQQNEVMCFLSRNCLEFYTTSLAVMSLGGICSGLNPIFTRYEIDRQLQTSQAAYLTTSLELLPVAEDAARRCSSVKDIFVIGESQGGHASIHDFMREKGEVPKVNINPKEDTAFLFFSSGTTGLPKGVKTTHYNLIASAALSGTSESYMFREEPQMVANIMPVFHNSGFIVCSTKPLFMGNTVVFVPKYEIEEFLKLIEKYKIRQTGSTPNLLSRLANFPGIEKYDLSSHDTFLLGGAPINPKSAEILRRQLGIKYIHLVYGCTEGSGLSHGTYHKETTSIREGSSGRLQPNMEVKIVDLDSGKELGYHETGEIWVKGPLVMKGFWNNPEADAETMTEDGWLKTGDVGYCDEETNIYIVDRIKDFIKCKGFQVAPAELEDWLMSHPAVAEAGVVGIPDSRVGEAPRAYVVLKAGAKTTAEELVAFTNSKVAAYKHLRAGVVFIDELPKTSTGKVQRKPLRELALKDVKESAQAKL